MGLHRSRQKRRRVSDLLDEFFKGDENAPIVDCRDFSSHGRLRRRFDTGGKSEPSPGANPCTCSCTCSCGTPSSVSKHRFNWWRLLVEVRYFGLCLQRSNAK